MQKINPCLWFDKQAEEAVHFYSKLFENSKVDAEVSSQKEASVMTIEFEIGGQSMTALNGGPAFKFNPSMSFYVSCDSAQEIDELWKQLSPGGQLRFDLDKYPWSEKYGWTSDRFGVEWQLILRADAPQKIMPAFMFANKLFGRGKEAIELYSSIFKESKILFKAEAPDGKSLMHCQFLLEGQPFVLMEGPGEHAFEFSPAFSLVVNCADQKQVDHFYERLSAGGSNEPCGWLRDKFGVSWQIVPGLVNMTKPDLQKIKEAYSR